MRSRWAGADEFGDLSDEGNIVVGRVAEASPRRVDLVDVVGRADLRAAVAVATDCSFAGL